MYCKWCFICGKWSGLIDINCSMYSVNVLFGCLLYAALCLDACMFYFVFLFYLMAHHLSMQWDHRIWNNRILWPIICLCNANGEEALGWICGTGCTHTLSWNPNLSFFPFALTHLIPPVMSSILYRGIRYIPLMVAPQDVSALLLESSIYWPIVSLTSSVAVMHNVPFKTMYKNVFVILALLEMGSLASYQVRFL